MNDTQIIESFYQAFQDHDAKKMGSLYHKECQFSDPVFQNLAYDKVRSMWSMLISGAKNELDIHFGNIFQKEKWVFADWEAFYTFPSTGRKVHNKISAKFQIRDDQIIYHVDHFDFWKWSRMALGLPGIVFGFTPYLRNKVRSKSRKTLERYMSSIQSQ